MAFKREDFPVLGRPASIIQMPIVLKRGRTDFTAKSVIVETFFNRGAQVTKHYGTNNKRKRKIYKLKTCTETRLGPHTLSHIGSVNR